MLRSELISEIQSTEARSAWGGGVQEYAVEILESLENDVLDDLSEKKLLRGADNWQRYSSGGCSLIYDDDIASRLCTPFQLKSYKKGMNILKNREWIDVQAEALKEACSLVLSKYTELQNSDKTSFFAEKENQ